ncbi:DUF1937 family protein [Shimia thalassica]|uniref:DUF1937 family protein n=1 Tax=Shimia thalassica TaxID=1715693 RepID=UPI0026E2E51A|nr:DUF1937 family protein [Shimia thalassica]MDO6523247.1 DUF1937 family protein [Shimia thalassica]
MNEFSLSAWSGLIDWPMLFSEYRGTGLVMRDAALMDVVDSCRGSVAYLASPYSNIAVKPDGQWCPVRSDGAAFEAGRWAAICAVNGLTAVSPVIQTVSMMSADVGDGLCPLDQCFWADWCAPLLRACGGVVVPPIEGWRESEGVWHEVCRAVECNVPVWLLRTGAEFGEGI